MTSSMDSSSPAPAGTPTRLASTLRLIEPPVLKSDHGPNRPVPTRAKGPEPDGVQRQEHGICAAPAVFRTKGPGVEDQVDTTMRACSRRSTTRHTRYRSDPTTRLRRSWPYST